MSELGSQLRKLLEERPLRVESILTKLEEVATAADEADLEVVEKLAEWSGIYDDVLAEPALAILLFWGKKGVHSLWTKVRRGHRKDHHGNGNRDL